MIPDQPEGQNPVQVDFSSNEYLLSVYFPTPENWDKLTEATGTDRYDLAIGIADTAQIVRRILLIKDVIEQKRQLTGFLDHCERLHKFVLSIQPPE